MKRDASSPEAYRNAVEGEQRELLDTIRALIFRVAPKVEETIGYGMLDYPGIANLAAQKHYVSLYVPPVVLADHAADFEGLNHGKSCLRFKSRVQLDERALTKLLRAVRKFRASQA